jgi:hypothetical protein
MSSRVARNGAVQKQLFERYTEIRQSRTSKGTRHSECNVDLNHADESLAAAGFQGEVQSCVTHWEAPGAPGDNGAPIFHVRHP